MGGAMPMVGYISHEGRGDDSSLSVIPYISGCVETTDAVSGVSADGTIGVIDGMARTGVIGVGMLGRYDDCAGTISGSSGLLTG